MRQFLNVSFPKSGTWIENPAAGYQKLVADVGGHGTRAPASMSFWVTPVVTSVTWTRVRLVLTFVVRSITSPAEKGLVWKSVSVPLTTSDGK